MVAALDNKHLLELIENLLFEETDGLDKPALTESESSMLRDRVAAYHADPNDEIPWEEIKTNLEAKPALRG